MKNLIFTTALTIVAFTLPKYNFAQTTDQFTGNWQRTEKTSLSGIDYANSLYDSIKVSVSNGQIAISRINNEPANAGTETLVINQSGAEETHLTKDQRRKNAVIKWNGNLAFTETTSYSKPADEKTPDFELTEAWTLSPDGKTLTVIRNFQSAGNPNDKWSVKGVFQKQ